MEKIKLTNGQILDIIPMGICMNMYERTRTISFVSNLGYADIESAFETPNIENIEYLSAAGDLLKTYSDCTGLKSLTKEFGRQVEDSIVSDVYTVVLTIV